MPATYNDPEGLTDWLRCLLDRTAPRLDLRTQKHLLVVGKDCIAAGYLRGDLSQWLAGLIFRRREDCAAVLELAPVGENTIPGRELFDGLYL